MRRSRFDRVQHGTGSRSQTAALPILLVAWLVLLPALSALGPFHVSRASAQADFPLGKIDLTVSHNLVNFPQGYATWGDIMIGPSRNPEYVMGACGCMLTALSTVVTYHLGNGTPGLGNSVPWFDVPLHQLAFDPNDRTIPVSRATGRLLTRQGELEDVFSFNPVYIDQYLQHGNLRDPYPPNWGYKTGFVDACGGRVYVDALENLANPLIVYDDKGNPVASTPSGVRLQWYDGFGTDVKTIIDRNLLAGYPTIVAQEVTDPATDVTTAHTQIFVGWDPVEEKYLIVDPAAPVWIQSHFPAVRPPGSPEGTAGTYAGWEQTVTGIFTVEPVKHVGRAPLLLRVSDDPAPFELLAINPDGQRSGFDPATGLTLYEDSAVNSYPQPLASDLLGELPSPPTERLLTVREPRPGTYRFLATATGDGDLILNFTTVAGHVLTEVGTVTEPIRTGELVKIEARSTGTAVEAVTLVDNFTPEARTGGDVGGAVRAEVTFDGRRSFDLDGTITSYAWDFGDGTTGGGSQPAHAYASPGIYPVTLTVTDDRGATATTSTRAVIGQAPPSQTAMISVSSTGDLGFGQGNFPGSFRPSMSADGRYVAFDSGAWNLVPGDSNAVSDIFVRDHQTGVTTRVSVSSSGAQANNASYGAAISADGRFVAFTSNASNLVPADGNAMDDIFVHDRETGTTERVSITSSGLQANHASSEPAISADGRFIAFQSVASNLVAGDTNGRFDIFVHDREADSTERVSLISTGAEVLPTPTHPSADSTNASISADGRFVTFQSLGGLVPDDTNGRRDVYLRDRALGTTERMSPPGEQGDVGGYLPAISGDGGFVTYVVNDVGPVVVLNRETRTIEAVGPDGAPQFPNPGDGLAISHDGRFVAFAATGNVLPDDRYIEAAHVYVRDRETGVLERVSVADTGEIETHGIMRFVYPAISDDGRFVAFGQGIHGDQWYRDTSLVSNDMNRQFDVFIRDRQQPEPAQPVANPSGPYLGWVASETASTSIAFTAEGSLGFNDLPLRAHWDFGDGSSTVTTDGLSVRHTYTEPGTYTLMLTVSDDLAMSQPMTTTVEVLPPLPPERLGISPSCADAGGALQISGFNYPQLDGLFRDEGPTASLLRDGWNFANGPLTIEPVAVSVSWQTEPMLLEPRLPDLLFQTRVSVPASLTAGSYAVASSGLESVSVSVPCPLDTNLPPIADAGGPSYTAATGVPITLDGSGSTDPEGAALTYYWDFGDGNHHQGDTPQFAYTFAYPGVYLVTLVVNDGQRDSTLGPGTRSYAVVTVTGEPPTSRPPTATAGDDVSGDEGVAIILAGTASDPDNDPLTTMWSYTPGADVDPGAICTFSDSASTSTTITCTDDGTYTVTLTANDGVNAAVADTATVTVGNASPVLTGVTGPAGPSQINTSVTVNATFSDAGVNDGHTSTIGWGDGSAPTTGTATAGSVTGNHVYTTVGVYAVAITVTDDDTGSTTETFQYVVVYDPSAGFVTGGGWITSPAGAYAEDPSLTGKASFGFVSKYKKGATVPDGQTQFQFHSAGLTFHSTAYEWLVIAGAKAQYKGTGTINGSGNYGFMLTATDGQVNGGGGTDTFRIKIWDAATGTIVYDNQMGAADDASATTALGGGSIVIHNPR